MTTVNEIADAIERDQSRIYDGAKLIRSQAAEIERFKDAYNKLWKERDALRTQLAAVQVDAARYRWMRDSGLEIRYRYFKKKTWYAVVNPYTNYDYDYEETLDAAIDAARAALKGTK